MLKNAQNPSLQALAHSLSFTPEQLQLYKLHSLRKILRYTTAHHKSTARFRGAEMVVGRQRSTGR